MNDSTFSENSQIRALNNTVWDDYSSGPHFDDGDRRQAFDWGWDFALELRGDRFEHMRLALEAIEQYAIYARDLEGVAPLLNAPEIARMASEGLRGHDTRDANIPEAEEAP